jgi:hypothetical protein
MINTVSDLLNEFLEREKENLKEYSNIGHPGMIGDIYEGLSKELLNKAIFKGLDIKIVDGKVRSNTGSLSNQIDCMMVVGEGEKIPYTNHYIYDFKNIIAVLESKKNLYSEDVSDAYQNMSSFNDQLSPSDQKYSHADIVRAFQFLTRKKFKYPLDSNNYKSQMLYHVLVVMHALPLRVILGYDGFKRNSNFRDALASYLTAHTGNKGFGINSLPDLIICDNYSILKCNFQPFQTSYQSGKFPILVSGTKNPLYYLISMIWAKLQIRFDLPDEIWGFEDEIDSFFPYLNTDMNIEKGGWEYEVISLSESTLHEIPPAIKFMPKIVSKDVFTLANYLCNHEFVNLISFGFKDDELGAIKNELYTTTFFEINDNMVNLITTNLKCAIIPTGEFVIADDVDGELTRWICRFMESRKRHPTTP